MAKRLTRWALASAILTAGIIGIAGHWTDPWLWGYALVWWCTSFYGMRSLDDDLARERFNPPEPGADRMPLRAVRLAALAQLLLGPLDLRFGLAPPVATPLRAIGLAGMAFGFFLVFRSMRENYFFSAVVRIQTERGHHVVSSGPYSVIRHPGYAGMIAGVPLGALAIGSWIGFGVALLYSGLILRRVIFEDGFLRRSLEGYDAYVQRVRYRLMPGVW